MNKEKYNKFLSNIFNGPLLEVDRIMMCEIGVKPAIVLTELKKLYNFNKENIILHEGLYKYLSYIGGKTSIKNNLEILQEKGLIKMKNVLPFEKRNFIISNKPDVNGKGFGSEKCSWCGINTLMLHEHHFPKTELEGGKKTVSICSNCHGEYHHITNKIIILSN